MAKKRKSKKGFFKKAVSKAKKVYRRLPKKAIAGAALAVLAAAAATSKSRSRSKMNKQIAAVNAANRSARNVTPFQRSF